MDDPTTTQQETQAALELVRKHLPDFDWKELPILSGDREWTLACLRGQIGELRCFCTFFKSGERRIECSLGEAYGEYWLRKKETLDIGFITLVGIILDRHVEKRRIFQDEIRLVNALGDVTVSDR